MKVIKSYIFLLLLIPAFVCADTRVNGFYSDGFVSQGYFKGESVTPAPRKKFFITREERKTNPEEAVSSQIKIPRNSIRVSQQLICLPGMGGCIENVQVRPNVSYE